MHYLKAPEVTRRNARVHFIRPLKERIVREVGYGLALEGASAAHQVNASQNLIRKGVPSLSGLGTAVHLFPFCLNQAVPLSQRYPTQSGLPANDKFRLP